MECFTSSLSAKLLVLYFAGMVAFCRSDWIDAASSDIASEALKATVQFLNQSDAGLGVVPVLQPGNGSQLMLLYKDAAARVLKPYVQSDSLHGKVTLRIQLDTIGATADTLWYRAAYNEKSTSTHIDVMFTPPVRTPADIDLTQISMAADIRWADVSGTGTEYISPSNTTTIFYHPWFMFYRTDVFQQHNVSTLPETWDDLLALIQRLNGTDFDGDGHGDHALCFNTEPHCQLPYILLSIFSPMVQNDLCYPGIWFDPRTMEPLVNNAAMRRALQIFQQLWAYNLPADSTSCLPHSPAFAAGKCAITFNMGQFRMSSSSSAIVQGNLGTSIVPGSSVFWHRPTDTLQQCTKALCPAALPSSSSSTLLVNYAPLDIALRTNTITTRATNVEAFTAQLDFYHFVTSTYSQSYVLPLVLDMASIGAGQLANSSTAADATDAAAAAGRALPSMPSALVAMGYHRLDVVGFLASFLRVYYTMNHLQAWDIALPGSSYFRSVLSEAAINATQTGASLANITHTMDTYYRMIASSFHDPEAYRLLYWSMIKYTAGPAAAGQPASPDPNTTAAVKLHNPHASGWKPGHTAGVAAGVLAASLLGIAAALVIRTRSSGRSILGAVLAPGTAPSTTLLVTDVQNSTSMWEKLPMKVMEEVVRVHHRTLRNHLDKHKAYESATEGDSFILAFHSPYDALAYATDVQQALLTAEWPEELLQHYHEASVTNMMVRKETPDVEASSIVQQLQSQQPPARSMPLWQQSSLSQSLDVSRLSVCSCLPQKPSISKPSTAALGASFSNAHMVAAGFSIRSFNLHGDVDDEDADVTSSEILADRTSTGSCTTLKETAGRTLQQALSQAWYPITTKQHKPSRPTGATTVWRGPRVRMGLHSGLADPLHVCYNKASHRTQYSGAFAATAKHVADAASGGQILLSHSAFSQLNASERSKGWAIMMMGEHQLVGEVAPMPLYQAVPLPLSARLSSYGPLRSVELMPGVLQAPIGQVSVVFMCAPSVTTLMAWNAELTQEAVQVFHTTARAKMHLYKGHIVELLDGLCLMAFQRPELAICWALAAQADLQAAPWPQELLSHQLCEPITSMLVVQQEGGRLVQKASIQSCGLRLKTGLATGRVVDTISEATGNVEYRGKVMNRAARIAAVAKTGEVLCHKRAWQLAERTTLMHHEAIVATSTGEHTLKGILQPLELYSCSYSGIGPQNQQSMAAPAGTKRRSKDFPMGWMPLDGVRHPAPQPPSIQENA